MSILIALLVFVIIAVVLLWLVDQFAAPLGTYKNPIRMIIVAILLVVFIIKFVAPMLNG